MGACYIMGQNKGKAKLITVERNGVLGPRGEIDIYIGLPKNVVGWTGTGRGSSAPYKKTTTTLYKFSSMDTEFFDGHFNYDGSVDVTAKYEKENNRLKLHFKNLQSQVNSNYYAFVEYINLD